MSERKPYTPDEDSYIREHYYTTSDGIIADHLNRTVRSIRKRARKIGLGPKKINRKWTDAEDKIILSAKGRTLHDVAKELNRDVSDTSKRARHLGINSWRRRNGYKSVRGYEVAYCKREGNQSVRKMVHTKVMEEYIGRNITPSERVHHIDTNKRNNRIENLYLCRNASEHRMVHLSLEQLLPELMERNIVTFNRDKGVYELCETGV